MERYQPTTRKERIQSTLGNLYIASSVQDVVESGAWIKDEYRGALSKIDQRAQAMLALRDHIFYRYGEFIPVYIYIPNVEHHKEQGRSRSITVPAESRELKIFIKPDNRLRLRDLKDSWYSDIVLFSIYRAQINIYQMSHFLGGHVADRRFLASRILKQET